MTEKSITHSEAEASDLRKKVLAAMVTHTSANIALAELLYAVAHGAVRKGSENVPLVVAWGHDNFDEFVEHESQIHQTTARGLVSLYEELYMRRSFPEGTLPASITKLRLLAKVSKRVPDGRAFNGWIAKARELSCCELLEQVEAEFGSDRKFRPLNLRLKLNKYTAFMRKMRSARDSFGVSSNGEALSRIVDEWHEQHAKTDRVRARSA